MSRLAQAPSFFCLLQSIFLETHCVDIDESSCLQNYQRPIPAYSRESHSRATIPVEWGHILNEMIPEHLDQVAGDLKTYEMGTH